MTLKYKEIKINSQFAITPFAYGWRLLEYHRNNAADKSKGRNKAAKETYHATLKQLCDFVIDRYACNAGSLNEIKAMLEKAGEDLTKELKSLI